MKSASFHSQVISLFILYLLFSAGANAQSVKTGNIKSLHWMAGCWEMKGKGFQIIECWTIPAVNQMTGMSQTIVEDSVVEFEYLSIRLSSTDHTIQYHAEPHGQQPTDFKLSRNEEGIAEFENQVHDFPRLIRYELKSKDEMTVLLKGENKGKPTELKLNFIRAIIK